MREIKFRLWDKTEKEMIYLDKVGDRQHHTFGIRKDGNLYYYNLQNGSGGDEYILMQSTGLKDEDCVEIYEKDIVRVMDSTFAIVKYSDDRGAYYLDCGKKIGDIGLICQYDTIKRVGNVYETPELLEGEE